MKHFLFSLILMSMALISTASAPSYQEQKTNGTELVVAITPVADVAYEFEVFTPVNFYNVVAEKSVINFVNVLTFEGLKPKAAPDLLYSYWRQKPLLNITLKTNLPESAPNFRLQLLKLDKLLLCKANTLV